MASTLVLACPVCGLLLAPLSATIKAVTDVGRDSELGGHLHFEVIATVQCTLSHVWRGEGDFQLVRVS